jgi:hypothetical protein
VIRIWPRFASAQSRAATLIRCRWHGWNTPLWRAKKLEDHMPTIAKSPVLGAALLVGIVIAANADPLSGPYTKTAGTTVNGMGGAGPNGSPQSPGHEVAALPPANAAPAPDGSTLPDVTVLAPSPLPGYHMVPYVNAYGKKTMVEHYQVPPGYDANPNMHPYTSGIGPSPAGWATFMAGSKPPSHYDK